MHFLKLRRLDLSLQKTRDFHLTSSSCSPRRSTFLSVPSDLRLSSTRRTFSSSVKGDLLPYLNQRGFIHSFSGIETELNDTLQKQCTAYVGFDPTADSLHVGNLLSIMGLAHFHRAGHKVIALVGGATGLIGDPSGKSKERNLLDPSTVSANAKGIEQILRKCFGVSDEGSASDRFKLVNNLDWYHSVNILDFFRDIGKHFRVNAMLQKDSVAARLETQEGISFTEFAYQVFQANDFLHLRRAEGCNIQLGGSDQFGNITAGCDLIAKVLGSRPPVFGVTFPLLTTADGKKVGKSEGNTAIWLSEDRTSVFDFYQFFLRTDDADVSRFLRMFTFLPLSEIEDLEKQHAAFPDARVAQKRLAQEVTGFVHGASALDKVIRATQVLYERSASFPLTWDALQAVFADIPKYELPLQEVENANVVNLAQRIGLAPSKAEVKRLIQGKALFLNEQRIDSQDYCLKQADILESKFCVLRSGKKNYKVVIIK